MAGQWSSTSMAACTAQRSAENAACDLTGDWVHIRTSNLQALRRLADRAKNLDSLRRSVALWRAGIRPGPAADLFIAHLPDDLNLDDAEAVRQACAEITAAALDGNRQLAEATP
jgi:hypothetical protein